MTTVLGIIRSTLRPHLPETVMRLYRSFRGRAGDEAMEWARDVTRQFHRDIRPLLAGEPAGPGAGLILFWCPMAIWPHVLIEYAIATNLRLRGYEVLFCVFDLGLPHSEMERAQFRPPDPDYCWRASRRILDGFDLPRIVLSDFVPPDEVRAVQEWVSHQPEEDLRSLVVGGIGLGQFSFQYLTTYFNGPPKDYGPREQDVFRRVLAGNLIAYRYAERVAARWRPVALVTINGNLCQTFPAFQLFRREGTRVVTWDDYPPYQDSFLFLQNETTADATLDSAVWSEVKNQALTAERDGQVDRFLRACQLGQVSDLVYHPNPDKSAANIRDRLGLKPDRRLFAAFTNVVWDSAALGHDLGFAGMMDWVYTLCDWFLEHPEQQLVIRVHPAERRLPRAYRTVNGVADFVRRRYGSRLEQGRIVVVDAEDDTYSYSLASMADAVGVYTTSLGLELAAEGVLPWVAGNVHYREKGFTVDVENASHLCALLARDAWPRHLTGEAHALARRYLYARVERQVTRVPFLSRRATAYRRPYFEDLRFLIPGRDPLVDALVDRVVDGKPFVDVPRVSAARVRPGR